MLQNAQSSVAASEVNSQLQVPDALGVKSFIQFWNAKLGQQCKCLTRGGRPELASGRLSQGGQETGRCPGRRPCRRCGGPGYGRARQGMQGSTRNYNAMREDKNEVDGCKLTSTTQDAHYVIASEARELCARYCEAGSRQRGLESKDWPQSTVPRPNTTSHV